MNGNEMNFPGAVNEAMVAAGFTFVRADGDTDVYSGIYPDPDYPEPVEFVVYADEGWFYVTTPNETLSLDEITGTLDLGGAA